MNTPEPVSRAAIMAVLKEIKGDVETVKADIKQAKDDIAETREIVEAWGAVKTAGKFLKWLAGVIAAIVAIGASVKLGVAHVIK